ncbi:hypothetical protein WA026_015244 [Henosepilachna vigintioctopunctata]|uniref:Uncharacterized protein n=1 Tax=Henosepilachna vigintioctopunctata TaxID=420089 RepID=A0AAW1TML2_9CUCU
MFSKFFILVINFLSWNIVNLFEYHCRAIVVILKIKFLRGRCNSLHSPKSLGKQIEPLLKSTNFSTYSSDNKFRKSFSTVNMVTRMDDDTQITQKLMSST